MRVILRAESGHGTVTREMADRASAIVEQTAGVIESDGDPELVELLASVRAEVADLTSG